MSEVKIFVKRQQYGVISLSGIQTLGQLISAVLDLINPILSLPPGYSGSDLIKDPPPHSDWSLSFFGKNRRYLYSCSFVNIPEIKNIKLDDPVRRRINNTELVDITYRNVNQIYFFHRLPDWHQLVLAEANQVEILQSHKNFLESHNQEYRAQNQRLRLNFRALWDSFLTSPDNELEPISNPIFLESATNSPQDDIQPIDSPHVNNVYQSPTPIIEPPSPDIIRHSPPRSPNRRLDSPRPPIESVPHGCPSYSIQAYKTNGVIGVLIDPTDSVPPENSINAIEEQEVDSFDMSVVAKERSKMAQELYNDYWLAQTLQECYNSGQDPGHDTIKRLAKQNIAKDPVIMDHGRRG